MADKPPLSLDGPNSFADYGSLIWINQQLPPSKQTTKVTTPPEPKTDTKSK
jgi:hypothetical protein